MSEVQPYKKPTSGEVRSGNKYKSMFFTWNAPDEDNTFEWCKATRTKRMHYRLQISLRVPMGIGNRRRWEKSPSRGNFLHTEGTIHAI